MDVLEQIINSLPQDDIPVEDVRVGPFLTAVRLAGSRPPYDLPRCGLASSLAQHNPGEEHALKHVGRFKELTARELAGFLKSENPLEASLGMAAVNALLELPDTCFQGRDVLDIFVEIAQDQPSAVIGHFPFVQRLRSSINELHVLELRPREGDLPADQAEEILPKCRAVILTATTLLNRTYSQILPLCREAFTVMMGPSTPASPVLFDYGVDVLAGSAVTDAPVTLEEVSQGATYRDLTGVKKWVLTRTDSERSYDYA